MSDFNRYSYTGPVYHNGHKISTKSNLFTMAKSFEQAERNFTYNVANGDIPSHYEIVPHFIKLVPPKQKIEEPIITVDKCETCGYQLNDMGDCPVCDYGEYDLLDLEG